MKITKYKKMSNNKYKVFLDNNENIVLHENIILKYNLLLTKEIDDLEEIKKDNNNYLIYDKVLKYISIKMRCESEIRAYLKKNEIDNKLIDEIVEKLKKQGFINEKLYVKSYILDKTRLNNIGPNKIKNELIKLNIDNNIIEEELNNINKEELNITLEKLIDKKIKSNRTYAGDVLKQKLLNDFINKGYSKEDILSILDKKDLNNDDLYEKEYKKLYNKYSKKYSGSELEYFIKQKLYQKGIKKSN
ncbi:MAG: RecX family transcriptional regulator [Bacilli bacterium]|nr:RecX family transcriptional regulator [Bacilli bacterium]